MAFTMWALGCRICSKSVCFGFRVLDRMCTGFGVMTFEGEGFEGVFVFVGPGAVVFRVWGEWVWVSRGSGQVLEHVRGTMSGRVFSRHACFRTPNRPNIGQPGEEVLMQTSV